MKVEQILKNAKVQKTKKQSKILGAGVSGLVSGIVLAKHGYNVKIFEKRPRIGSFLEKDIHSLRNYSFDCDIINKYRRLGIKISNFYPIVKQVRYSASLKSIEIYSRKKPLFYNVVRGYADERSLDVDLFEQAKANGAEVVFNQKIDPDRNNMDIIATGARYRKGIIYGRHYRNVSVEPNTLYFFLNSNRSSYGYTYINPFFGKEASIAIVSPQSEKKEYLKRKFNTIVKNKVISKIIKNAEVENEFFGFAFFDTPETAVRKGKLYVGEAAGFLDATTGFGLHYAILSGCLAARSIIEKKDYDKLWKETFGKELERRYSRKKLFKKMGIKGQKKIIKNLIEEHGKRISINAYVKLYSKIPQEVKV